MPQESLHSKPASHLAPPRHSSPSPSQSSTGSSSSSLGRKIRGLLCIPRSSDREGPPKIQNPLGLNTVYQPDKSTGVIADFVFVHGLGGGSSTTWCIKANPESFWPGEWLPNDPDFDGVRIHSFGYNSNWKSYLKSPLDVHAFGQSLVEELLSDPKIKASDTPIVLIGHSMGGLVIKKACILCKTTPGFAHLAKRFHSFYFLGTPHRGSNLAKVLNNLLRISGRGRRAYVAGLESKSETIRVLNDSFRVNYAGIHLHSFYETLPIPPLGLIVDVESATLGYADERVQLLNANHQNLIKYDSTEDSNYRSLRNRLASTVQQIRSETQRPSECENSQRHREHEPPPTLPSFPRPSFSGSEIQFTSPCLDNTKSEQMETLRIYLGIDYSPDDVLSSLNDARLHGSCSWLPAKSSFQEWLCASAPRYFWLKGAPASGKSTVASHVVEYLKEGDYQTCHYFFKAGEKATSNLGSFLRSMAYQMADLNSDIRVALVQLAQQGPALDVRNPKSLWRNLFASCVLRQQLTKPIFWVIDAVDEGTERGHADEYFLLLSKIDHSIPLKVFVTSRPDFALDNLFTQLPTITAFIKPEDSLGDIRLYVDTWSLNLPAADAVERKRLVDVIVDMSGGSFLWTVLVMKKLQQVMTVEGIHQVLREVPQKMSELYQHNIKTIEVSETKDLAKHIIVWAICAIFPLTVGQMKDAIRLSLKITVARDLRHTLQHICGQFLDVDIQSRVQVVHETARAFLTDPNLHSEFRVDRPKGHGVIADACLEYLLGEEFQHCRRRRSRAAAGASRTTMDAYVCLHWSEHLVRSSASSDHLFELLVKFFQTNVLSWIERVVLLKDLDCLNRTSRHLSSFLGRRTKYVPLLSTDISAWTVDLPRIATQFGANLLNDPTSIHTLIPPLCPRDSAIYKRFGSSGDGITLVGAWNSSWDDRICSISYHEARADGVSARDHVFAVRLSNGLIKVYQTSTCEERLSLRHGEFLFVLDFGHTAKFIASAGLRSVRLWDTATGEQLFLVNTDTQTLALGFNETESQLIVASRDKYITVFQIPEGTQLHRLPWLDTFLDTRDLGSVPNPTAVTLCTELQVMAVIYRSKHVQLWSLESHRPIGACIRPSATKHAMANHLINSAAFNPAAAKPSLLVSYWDDFIAVYDVVTCKTLATTSARLVKIAIAPNGKTFAGSEPSGDINIFDFETLQFLHRISVKGDPVTSLVFTSDSLRIMDTRGTQANIWEPLVLASQDSDSQCSERSESVNQIMEDVGDSTIEQTAAITSLHCCDENGMALCGRDDGWVDICDLDNPENTMRHLYQHRGAIKTITCIDWASRSGIAVSADCLGIFRVMKITTEPHGTCRAEAVAESELQNRRRITQLLVHPDGSHVLISSPESDTVWSIVTKQAVATLTDRRRTAWKWFVRSSAPSQLILFEDGALRFFNWTDLAELATAEASEMSTPVETGPTADADADAISISSDGNDLVFIQKMHQCTPLPQAVSPHLSTGSKIHVFDLSLLSAVDLGLPSQSSQPLSRAPSRPPPYSDLPPKLNNPFLSSSSDSPLSITKFSSPSSAPARRRSFLTSVAEIPGLDSVIGTVKKFNSWFLIFISREGWVCSLELGAGGEKPFDTYHKHFFIPSVWRTATSSLITKVCRCQDIVFVYQNGVIVVKNGLDNGKRVSFSQS